MRLATVLKLGLTVLSLSASPEHALANPIYVFKDKGGAIRFTTKPPPSGVPAEVFTAKGIPYSILGPRRPKVIGRRLYTEQHSTPIAQASETTGLPEDLIRSVIHAESAFQSSAVSPKGARGLMQLMPALAHEYGVKNSFDPAQNILAGTRYLASLLSNYRGDLKLALAAYNAGPGAVEQYGGVPPYEETRQYIETVMALRTRYAAARNNTKAAGLFSKKASPSSHVRHGQKNP
ncbi:MAG: lytic transglycosylase domain-containing protein [Oligoflexia bacterium]|nr:lytic transglycosylase domain-containing protein [Oligoflexia bacterium]